MKDLLSSEVIATISRLAFAETLIPKLYAQLTRNLHLNKLIILDVWYFSEKELRCAVYVDQPNTRDVDL